MYLCLQIPFSSLHKSCKRLFYVILKFKKGGDIAIEDFDHVVRSPVFPVSSVNL